MIIVKNEDKQILSLHLTKKEAFDNVGGYPWKTSWANWYIVLDNCCKWKQLILKIFGCAEVKIDPFLLSKVLLSHKEKIIFSHKLMWQELRMLLRLTDSERRKLPTAWSYTWKAKHPDTRFTELGYLMASPRWWLLKPRKQLKT